MNLVRIQHYRSRKGMPGEGRPGWRPIVLAGLLVFLLRAPTGAGEPVQMKAQEQGRPGTQERLPAVASCMVAVGDPSVAQVGVSGEVTTSGVLVVEDKVLVPLLAVTQRSLDINSGKVEALNPLVGGDQMLGAGVELVPVQRVPMHVWDADAKKVHTMEAKLVAADWWQSLALYQLPQRFPGRSATVYEGDVPDGLKVLCYPLKSFSLKEGPAVQPLLDAPLITRAVSEEEQQGDWGAMLDAGWPMRGAGVFADRKLVGVVSEFTHYRIEPSPTRPEKRRLAVYVILASRIREFLRNQRVL